jgi:hypothetical protein
MTEEKKKEKEKEIKIDPNFEKVRIALMNHYNTQTLAHAGYIVALTVGIVTLFSRIDAFMEFFEMGVASQFLCYAIVSILLSLIIYVAFRIVFWAWMGSVILTVTKEMADSTNGLTEIYRIQNYLKKKFGSDILQKRNPYFWARKFTNWGIIKSLTALFIMFVALLVLSYWGWQLLLVLFKGCL